MTIIEPEEGGIDLQPAIQAALENATRLSDDANCLAEEGRRQTAFVIAVLAREEFAKAFLLILSQSEKLPWTVKFQDALRSHVCKQLVSYILCELSAVDLFSREHILKWPRRVHELPRNVVDAFHILVHEHFHGNERDHWWDREQDAPLDPTVRDIAAGAIERQKQDALYVRYGWNGSLRSEPLRHVSESEWKREARRLDLMKEAFWVPDGRLTGSPAAWYGIVAALVRLLAGLMSAEEFNRDWW